MAGGVDSLSVLAPVGDPQYRKLRPKLALADSEGTPVRRGRAPALASLRRRPRDAARRGQGHGDAGRRLRPPGPVALQLAPLLRGRRAPAEARDGLDGPLPRPRRDDGQPAPGAGAERRPRARRSRRPSAGGGDRRARRLRLRGARRVGRGAGLDDRGVPVASGQTHAGSRDAGDARRRERGGPVRAPAPAAAAVRRRSEIAEPGRLPGGRRLGLLAPARGARGDARRRSAAALRRAQRARATTTPTTASRRTSRRA